MSPIRTNAPVKQEPTIQEFCNEIYRAVQEELERPGRTSQTQGSSIKNEVLWHASQLWEGKHPKHRRVCRDVAWAASFVLGLLAPLGEETDADLQTATATRK